MRHFIDATAEAETQVVGLEPRDKLLVQRRVVGPHGSQQDVHPI